MRGFEWIWKREGLQGTRCSLPNPRVIFLRRLRSFLTCSLPSLKNELRSEQSFKNWLLAPLKVKVKERSCLPRTSSITKFSALFRLCILPHGHLDGTTYITGLVDTLALDDRCFFKARKKRSALLASRLWSCVFSLPYSPPAALCRISFLNRWLMSFGFLSQLSRLELQPDWLHTHPHTHTDTILHSTTHTHTHTHTNAHTAAQPQTHRFLGGPFTLSWGLINYFFSSAGSKLLSNLPSVFFRPKVRYHIFGWTSSPLLSSGSL